MRILLLTGALLLTAEQAGAQSLFILQGEHAAEGAIAWSVGPFSNGIEVYGGASLGGRWDIGFGFNHYDVDLGGADDSKLDEWTPWVRYFVFKEADDSTPLSVAVRAQYFQDDFGGDDDGWYLLSGGELYKKFALGQRFALYPYIGFFLAAESYSFGGGDPDRALYLTRQFGVHGQFSLGADTWLRATLEEHSFRRETYRAARLAYVRRF